MRLANLTRSEPFKAALRVLGVFLVLYVGAAWALVRSVEATLTADLETLSSIESELLTNIYRSQGQDGLIAALAALEADGAHPERAYGLFDARNLSLTGPLSVRPDFVGFDTREVSVLSRGRIAGQYVLWVDQVDQLTLVIGRNHDMIEEATARVTRGLIAFGALLTLSTIVLGLWAGYRSQRRLDEMEVALHQVSRGQLAVRLPIGPRNDQFDRVAERMNDNLARLERLVASVKSTASSIAHDLKTPLSHTQIALNEAADALERGEDGQAALAKALLEADKLNQIFDTVLRLSRLQSVTDRSHFAPLDLRDVAQTAVDFLHPTAEERGQTLRLDAGSARIEGDEMMLQQAVINLVQNACVHSGDGAEISLSLQETEQSVQLTVRDTGPGLPPEALEQVLEPFARAEAARSTPGHGLGLPLVRAIAELHKAQLTLANATPGLRATLTFPKFKKS